MMNMRAHKAIYAFYLIVLLGITLVFLKIKNVRASDNIIFVPDDYPTIQDAIEAANRGNTIIVRPGKYVECLKINKPLKLIGSGINITILENAGNGHTVEISKEANNVLLKGFTIQCSFESKWAGIYVRGLNNALEDNYITGHHYGIQIYDSSLNILRNNIMENNTYNFGVWGLFLTHFIHDIDLSNIVNRKPILYWINQHEKCVSQEVGYVAIVNSSRIVIKNLSISNNLVGVLLAYTNNSLVINVTATKNERGLYMVNSHNNVVVLNNFSENHWSGISAISSSKNIFAANNISLNLNCGIRLSHSYNLLNTISENNTIIGNTIKSNKDGLYLEKSNNNFVCGNTFVENTQAAIVSDESSRNIIRKNMIENNEYGLRIIASKDLIYNNVFINNSIQVDIYPYLSSSCVWNDSYPNGGNFWSDYKGVDEKSGINQDQPGGDGIGDYPYTIDAKNQDRYPLMLQCLENDPPKADFSQNPIEARIEEGVLFRDNSFDVDGQILLNLWNIDGEYYWLSKEWVKLFTEEKTVTAMLIVFDDNGAINFTSKTFSVRRFISTLIILAQDKANVGEKIEISAVLMDEDNNPIVGALVYFYISDSSFEDFIGYAPTNSFGVATLYYDVEKEGNLQLKALFMGNEKYAGTSTSKSLFVKGNPYTFWIFTSLLAVTVIFTFLRFKKRIKMRRETLGKL